MTGGARGAAEPALRAFVLCAALFTAACRTTSATESTADDEAPSFGREFAGAPGVSTAAKLGIPTEIADIAATAYPSPRSADWSDVFVPLEGALRADERSEGIDALLREAGLEIGWRDLPAGGCAVSVTWDGTRAVLIGAARDDPGRVLAASILRQVTVESSAGAHARVCRILDAPGFPLRGNKRPQPWELAYRANFAWEVRDLPGFEGRTVVATAAPGSPLDATPQGVSAVMEQWRPWIGRGVTRFCVKFDDVGFGLSPDSAIYYGNYPTAICAYIGSLRDALRKEAPAARLWWLPQTYWWRDRRLATFASAIAAAGGLPEDVGLVMTGPEIISPEIDADGLAAVRLAFGLTSTPAILYDNLGREGDWGPLVGRDPRLHAVCDAVFGERGTPVHRLTRLDWAWNPGGYDAERSWRRAILELAGPAAFVALHEVCAAFRRGAPTSEIAAAVDRLETGPDFGPGPVPVPRSEIVKLLRGDLTRNR